MAKARTIIRNALTFGLNRLSPGEQEDADLFARCLDALGSILDEINGSEGMLWREEFTTSSAITGMTANLGVEWPGLTPGNQVLGASVKYSPGGQDIPLNNITMDQYADIPVKSTASIPRDYAFDGGTTLYFYPACAGQTVTLRTLQQVTGLTDLDTDYVLVSGFQSALEALLAEKMAPTLNPAMLPKAEREAAKARLRIARNVVQPDILSGSSRSANILTGWN